MTYPVSVQEHEIVDVRPRSLVRRLWEAVRPVPLLPRTLTIEFTFGPAGAGESELRHAVARVGVPLGVEAVHLSMEVTVVPGTRITLRPGRASLSP